MSTTSSKHDLIRPCRPRSGTPHDRDARSPHLLPLTNELPHPRDPFGQFHPFGDLIDTGYPRDERGRTRFVVRLGEVEQ